MMMAMRQAERLLKVQELFSKEEFVSLDDLCKRFGASKSSIRRDLIELENRGIMRRVHGGAISLQTRDDVLDFKRLSISCHEEKARIGKIAAGQIEDGQTVILGGGSTVVEVASNLRERPIQIVTNSIPVAEEFWDSKQAEVTLTGGYLYPRLGVQLGPICERMLHDVSADVLVMGIRGITDSGLSDTNSLIVESLRAMVRAARKVIIVSDHSKFGRDAMVHVVSLDEVDQVISDQGLDPAYQKMLKEHNIDYLLA